MKIAIFGGRFDPVHNGHLKIGKEILKTGKFDEVWLVPDYIHQWNPIVASGRDRLNMLSLAIKDDDNNCNSKLKINDVAIKIGGTTNTIDVIKKLKSETKDSFIFICGSDQVPNFHKWKEWTELSKILPFIIMPRKGFRINKLPKNCVLFSNKNYEPLDDASTVIRDRIKKKLSIANLVSKSVEEYIIKQALYK